jgi:hypothetical protein
MDGNTLSGVWSLLHLVRQHMTTESAFDHEQQESYWNGELKKAMGCEDDYGVRRALVHIAALVESAAGTVLAPDWPLHQQADQHEQIAPGSGDRIMTHVVQVVSQARADLRRLVEEWGGLSLYPQPISDYPQTIPDAVLDAIIAHRPHLAQIVRNLRANMLDSRQVEQHIARAYLHAETRLSATNTLHLAQVAEGGPWGGDWWRLNRAAEESGYSPAHLRRLAGEGTVVARKYGKTWYVRKDSIPMKGAEQHAD